MFSIVTLVTGVGRALPPSLSNLHNVCHVSQLQKYISDSSHVIQLDDVQVRENSTVVASPLLIDD